MKIPATVKIGAHIFKVKTHSGLGSDEHCGKSDMAKLEIFIRSDLPNSMQGETLIHEALHQIRQLNGIEWEDDKEDEKRVQIMGHGLFQFLVDNGLIK